MQVRRAAVLQTHERNEHRAAAGCVSDKPIQADLVGDLVGAHDLPRVASDDRPQLRMAAIEPIEERLLLLLVDHPQQG
jgi:hypothetical protein